MLANVHPTQGRKATLAGIASAACLVGAVTLVAALIAGVVAHTTWPPQPRDAAGSAVGVSSGGNERVPAVRASSPLGRGTAPTAVATPTSAGVSTGTRSPSSKPRLEHRVAVAPHRGGAAPRPVVGNVGRPPLAAPLTPGQRVEHTTITTTSRVGDGVKDRGTDVGTAVGHVNPPLGGAVTALSINAGAQVSAIGVRIGVTLGGGGGGGSATVPAAG